MSERDYELEKLQRLLADRDIEIAGLHARLERLRDERDAAKGAPLASWARVAATLVRMYSDRERLHGVHEAATASLRNLASLFDSIAEADEGR